MEAKAGTLESGLANRVWSREKIFKSLNMNTTFCPKRVLWFHGTLGVFFISYRCCTLRVSLILVCTKQHDWLRSLPGTTQSRKKVFLAVFFLPAFTFNCLPNRKNNAMLTGR